MTHRTMKSAWRKLWPDCISGIEGYETESVDIVDDIVFIGNRIGLEVDNVDVEELVEDHSNELTTKELEQLLNEQQKTVTEEILFSETDERMEDVPRSSIHEMCAKWSEVQSFVEDITPIKLYQIAL